MNLVTKRLRQWVDSNYSSVGEFSRAMGISIGQASQLLNAYRLPGNKMQSKLRELGCDIEWLMTGKEQGSSEVSNSIPMMTVPVFAHVNAGSKKWVVSVDIVDYVAIPKSSDKTLVGVIVKGDSMRPEINDGDTIILSSSAETKSGDLCVVEWEDGDRHLRRVTFQKQNVILTSNNNDEYPPIITQKSKIRKLFRVMKHIRNY